MTSEFAKLTQSLWTSVNTDSVSPSGFRNQVQRCAPKFVGCKWVFPVLRKPTLKPRRSDGWNKNAHLSLCSQQDAQEFLRFLLDGLHSEVNRVTVCPKVPVEDFDHLLWVCMSHTFDPCNKSHTYQYLIYKGSLIFGDWFDWFWFSLQGWWERQADVEYVSGEGGQ